MQRQEQNCRLTASLLTSNPEIRSHHPKVTNPQREREKTSTRESHPKRALHTWLIRFWKCHPMPGTIGLKRHRHVTTVPLWECVCVSRACVCVCECACMGVGGWVRVEMRAKARPFRIASSSRTCSFRFPSTPSTPPILAASLTHSLCMP